MTSFQKKSWLAGFALIAIATLSAIGYAFAAPGEPAGQPPSRQPNATALPVETFVLGEIEPPEQTDWYRGVVVASKEADLGFRRGGRVEAIGVNEGDRAEQGDVLATLDASDVRSQLASTHAQVAVAEAMFEELVAGPRAQTIDAARSDVKRLDAVLALSRATADRQRVLLQSNAASVQQFDDARFMVQQNEAALESASQQLSELLEGTRAEQVSAQRARVDALKAEAARLEVDLGDTRIVAPFDGLIAKRRVDEGTIVGAQSVVLRLIQCDPLEARFGVSPADARSLTIGMKVSASVEDQAVPALILRIEPELDLTSRTQGVFVTLQGGCDAGIVPGQTASLAIPRARAEALWVPIGALTRAARGLWSVNAVIDVKDGVGRVERRDVQVIQTDTDVAMIVGTMVKRGDRLIAGGTNRITPGMQVSVESRAGEKR